MVCVMTRGLETCVIVMLTHIHLLVLGGCNMGRHSGWVVDGFLLGRPDGEEEIPGSVDQRGLSLYGLFYVLCIAKLYVVYSGLCYMLCIVIYYILNSGDFVALMIRKHHERCSPSRNTLVRDSLCCGFGNGFRQRASGFGNLTWFFYIDDDVEPAPVCKSFRRDWGWGLLNMFIMNR